MKRKTFFAVLFIGCILMWAVGGINAEENKPVQSPSVFFPQTQYTFTTVVEGVDIIHKFVVQNKGASALKIEKVRTG